LPTRDLAHVRKLMRNSLMTTPTARAGMTIAMRDLTASGPPPAGKMDGASRLSLEDIGRAAFAQEAREEQAS
jgi:hypothetical protein